MYLENNDYDKNMFIFGKSIDTKFGLIRSLTYQEFLFLSKDINILSQNTLHIYYQYLEMYKKSNATKEEIESLLELKELDLFQLVQTVPQLKNAYLKIYQLVFDENEEYKIYDIFDSKEDFHFIRTLFMDMNVLIEDSVSPNEEIQRAIERSRRMKKGDAVGNTFVDITTSIVASTSYSFEEVADLNVFQVYAIYARIGAIYNYQTSTLFATVAEKVKIESWNKHINLFEEETNTISKDEFDRKFGGMLKM